MRGSCLYSLFACVMLSVVACQAQPEPVSTDAPLPPETTEPVSSEPIGRISRVQDKVEHGRADETLQELMDEAELIADDRIGVGDGGEALLDFGNAMRVNLFNNSEAIISTRVADDAPLVVHFVLWRGGLVGEKSFDDDRQVEIDTPAGARVTVVGTIFFVTYDANTEITTVGNFGGTVTVVSGEEGRVVPEHAYVIIEPARPPGMPQPFALDAAQFSERARALVSPLAAVDELQAGSTPTPTATSTPSPSPTATGTATLTPTSTPAPTNTPTATRVIPTATFTVNANCRRGPGLIYEVLRSYSSGDRLLITGRNDDASWWRLDTGGAACWAADSVVAVENGHLVEVVPTPATPTLTPSPTPTHTPTPASTSCQRPFVSIDISYNHPDVEITWGTFGGCNPFTGTLTGRFSYQNEDAPYLTRSISSRFGSYTDYPPCAGGDTVTIIYTVTLYDATQQRTSDSESVEYSCPPS